LETKEYSEKSNAGGITIPDFKLYYKAKAARIAYYRHKNRYGDFWKKREDPDMNLHSYAYLTFDSRAKNS
jgi:hypothetical protein